MNQNSESIVIFRNTFLIYSFHISNEEEIKLFMDYLRGKDTPPLRFKRNELVLLGNPETITKNDIQRYFSITPPHKFNGVPFGRRTPLMHYYYIMQLFEKPKFAIITKHKNNETLLDFYDNEKKFKYESIKD